MKFREVPEGLAVLSVAAASSFLTPFMGSALNVAMPRIGAELGMSAVFLTWVATSYLLAAAVFLVPLGRLADRFGRVKVFKIGLAGFGLTSLAAAMAPTGAFLVGVRVVQGISGAMTFATGLAILTAVFPPQFRGRALGFTVASVYLGGALGPVVGGVLTYGPGWRSIFLLSAGVSLPVLGLSILGLRKEQKVAPTAGFDLRGSVIWGIMVLSGMMGLSRLASTQGLVLLGVGLLHLPLFLWVERKAPAPVVEVSLFRSNPVYGMSNLAALINYSATFAVGFLVSLYLQYMKLLTPRDAGLILIAQPLMMAVLSPLAGRLSDRFEPRLLASLGMLAITLGLVGFALLTADSSLSWVVADLLFLGAGFGLFSSPNMNAIMGSVPRKHYGDAAATASTVRLLGQVTSMGVMAVVFALVIGGKGFGEAPPTEILHSLRVSFLLFAGFSVLGLFASFFRGNLRSGPSGAPSN